MPRRFLLQGSKGRGARQASPHGGFWASECWQLVMSQQSCLGTPWDHPVHMGGEEATALSGHVSCPSLQSCQGMGLASVQLLSQASHDQATSAFLDNS